MSSSGRRTVGRSRSCRHRPSSRRGRSCKRVRLAGRYVEAEMALKTLDRENTHIGPI